MAERTAMESGVIRVDASGRRQYSVKCKQRLARLVLEPGASVAGIALAHRINANPLFKWRQDYLRQRDEATALEPKPEPKPDATLLLVVVAPAGRALLDLAVADGASGREPEPPPSESGQIEVQIGRARVRVTGAVDPALVETVLSHLDRR